MPENMPHNGKPFNSFCPGCGVVFGYVVKDGKVTCPICSFVQPLPIIRLDDNEYFCIPCRASRMALSVEEANCINCGRKPQWRLGENQPSQIDNLR